MFANFFKYCHEKDQNLSLNFTYIGLGKTELKPRFLTIFKILTPERGELMLDFFIIFTNLRPEMSEFVAQIFVIFTNESPKRR